MILGARRVIFITLFLLLYSTMPSAGRGKVYIWLSRCIESQYSLHHSAASVRFTFISRAVRRHDTGLIIQGRMDTSWCRRYIYIYLRNIM